MRAKSLFSEYIWLVNTINRAGRISLEEINRKWRNTDLSGGVDFARSTFNRHKEAIEDLFGVIIECDRRDGYSYYIWNKEVLEDDTIQNWMLTTMSVNNIVSESRSIYDRIQLESIPSAGDILKTIIEAMKESVKIKFFYQKYSSEKGRERIVEPYCLKLYRRRWYILAKTDAQELRMFSLDRIITIAKCDEKFTFPSDFSAAEFFRERVGVMIQNNIPSQRVVVRTFGNERYYLRDLPVHPSQREIAATEEYTDFEYYMIPTVDYSTYLLSKGEYQVVLEPEWLAEQIEEMHKDALERYNRNRRVE